MRIISRLAFAVVCSWVVLATAFADGVEVPANQRLVLTLSARGVQIYECKAAVANAGKFEWVFKSPEADLFDAQGHKVGRHYAGPTWALNDGSKVVGKLKAKTDSPDAKSIPWLLLDATEASGPSLGNVTSIQRVDTVGGKAPSDAPTPDKVGQETRVDYTATYKFYAVQP